MSNPVIFKDLPATFPNKDMFQKPSVATSILFHVLLVVALIIMPLMFPQTVLQQWQLMTMLVAPPPPPPAAPPPPVDVAPARPEPVVQLKVAVDPNTLFVPLAIPKDIAHIVDEPLPASAGVVGGVVGGVRGGVAGLLGGINNMKAEAVIPPPPPPPPPAPAAPPAFRDPIRVGGNVREPKLVKLVQPIYPSLASRARVSGTVVLEATLTVDGKVENINVISGHPLLVTAALDCVKQWEYEPTYLNGTAVEVILTAIVKFNPRPAQ